jgi:hypothetical protein
VIAYIALHSLSLSLDFSFSLVSSPLSLSLSVRFGFNNTNHSEFIPPDKQASKANNYGKDRERKKNIYLLHLLHK